MIYIILLVALFFMFPVLEVSKDHQMHHEEIMKCIEQTTLTPVCQKILGEKKE